MAYPRAGYPSDLTDGQWEILEPLVPKCRSTGKRGGRPEQYAKREIINAIFYIKTTGCQWKYLPSDLPPWPVVYHYLRECVRTHCHTTLEVVKRTDPHKFVVLAKRWIVEPVCVRRTGRRTFAWLSKARRLAREYETTPRSEEGMIYVAMIHLLLRRVI